MKKNFIKTAFAAVCVVAAGLGGLKAYNYSTQSQANMLLAENIDALSAGDGGNEPETVSIPCKYTGNPMDYCKFNVKGTDGKETPVQL